MNFDSSKIIGGIGALLLFIGCIPYLGGPTFGILPLVGLILLLIGLKGLADYYKEAGIFNNALYGTILGIVGAVVFVAIILISAVGFITNIFPSWNGNWATLAQIDTTQLPTDISWNLVGPFLAGILISLVVLFVFVLLVAFLYRRSLNQLRDKSNIGLFGSAGTVLLIGAVLTIILIGLLLVWIAILLVAIAFFQLKEPQSQTSTTQYPPPYQPQA